MRIARCACLWLALIVLGTLPAWAAPAKQKPGPAPAVGRAVIPFDYDPLLKRDLTTIFRDASLKSLENGESLFVDCSNTFDERHD